MTLKLLKGGRSGLEHELLRAMFTPGAEPRATELKARLARRAGDQLSAVNAETCRPATDDADVNQPDDGG